MALERSDVETWAEFGFIDTSCSTMVVGERDVFLCTGCNEIYVFNTKERKLMASKSDSLQSDRNCSVTPVLPFFFVFLVGCPPVS